MPRTVAANAERIRQIKTFPSLVKYLRDELNWPIEADDFEDLTYDWEPEELGIDKANAAKIDEVKQLRPLADDQPWGIFFVKFEPKQLPVVALRRLLNSMVIRKRESANNAERQAWAMNDLMFISSYGDTGERHISFAHFSQSEGKNGLPTLRVLGWDNSNTPLHLDRVASKLAQCLSWPDDMVDVEGWRQTWQSAFTLRHREVITTSKELSIRLAELARVIRDRIRTALTIETEKGPLTRLMKAFQTALVHDLDEAGFADMYAQTIAYGLLSARITDPHRNTADDFAAHMRTNPFLRELMETFLKVGGRRGKVDGPGIDFDELGVSDVVELLDDANMEAVVSDFGDRNPQEDPVIHFYELFLREYDANIRMKRGVFYTPRQAVSFIVRSVDDLLRKEFDLADGLADTTTWGAMVKHHKGLEIPKGISPDQDFVCILDPATGTGTFLVEMIDLIHKTLIAKWKAQGHGDVKIDALWNEYVPKHLLTRLYGYELLMAPYAIAHLKIGLKLYETGYRFESTERAHVYLTDSLEPARDYSGVLAFAVPSLAHEAKAVDSVKNLGRFTVVVGNPPYLREKERGPVQRSERIGGWVRYGDARAYALFDDFITPLAERNLGVHAKLAYELSVMFWRLALWIAWEKNIGPGIVGMISPRAYITGPGHTGMRHWIRQNATSVWITDLGGDNRGARKSENIFEIETGVAIGICVRAPKSVEESCVVRYSEVTGSATEKLQALGLGDILHKPSWKECESGNDTFMPTGGGDYSTWPRLSDLFPWQHSGSQFKRLWPIAESKAILLARWGALVSLPKEKRAQAYIETRDRLSASANPGVNSKKFTGISDLKVDSPAPSVIRYCYRSLDRQWCFADERLADYLRPSLVSTLGPKQVFAATLMSKPLGQGPAISVTNCLPDMDVFCNRGAKDVIPLWRDPLAKHPNVTGGLLEKLSALYGCDVRPEDLFCYCVAVLASPQFAKKYEPELASPGVRVPISVNSEKFLIGAALGARVVWLQTFGERWLGKVRNPKSRITGKARLNIPIPGTKVGYPKQFEYDESTRTLIVGEGTVVDVAPEVYGYSQSGFKVVESWLRYRMAERGGRARRESSRSVLDEIRPTSWCFTDELLELLWVVEGCVELWPEIDSLLESITSSPTIPACDLPLPTSEEQKEPDKPNASQRELL